MDFRQIKAIEKKNKEKILELFPLIDETSGIYIMTREENGFKYAYVGQAKHLLTRLAQHLTGYQHIDLSIKKHGLFDDNNVAGWQINCISYFENDLDYWEQYWIKQMADMGYQLRNKTAGGQGEGKVEIAETKPKKTYYDGLKQGRKNTQKEIAKLFEKHLEFSIKGKQNKNNWKAYVKFKNFLEEN